MSFVNLDLVNPVKPRAARDNYATLYLVITDSYVYVTTGYNESSERGVATRD